MMKLCRAELQYLGACGWILFIGMGVGDNPDLAFLDAESDQWKMWGAPGATSNKPEDLYTQAQAIAIQRAKDKF
jgi:hypothetical protein